MAENKKIKKEKPISSLRQALVKAAVRAKRRLSLKPTSKKGRKFLGDLGRIKKKKDK